MSEQVLEPRVYLIPETNFAELDSEIKRLQRRAVKLGSEPIALTVLKHEDYPGYVVSSMSEEDRVVYLRPDLDPNVELRGSWRPSQRVRRFYSVTVTGPSPVLEGYTFIGAVDVIRDDAGKVVGNMVRTLPGKEMPDIYRIAEPHCDHCNIRRNWKSMYVVQHLDGNHSQVGRQCLKDFTGHKSPESLMAAAELMMSVGNLLSSSEEYEEDRDDDGRSGGRRRARFGVKSILTMVATIVRTDGWKPKSQEFPTVDTLRQWLYARGKEEERMKERYVTKDEDRKTAEETIDWLVSLSERAETLNDYEHNLSLFGLAGSVEDKVFAFVASAIPAYQRTKDRQVYLAKEQAVSSFVSEVGKRSEMTLTLANKQYRESDYGVQTRCKYHDDQGNVVIWWASGGIDTEEGAKLRVKATVKKHEEYNGVKQTIVSRLAVLDIISSPEVTR